MRMKLFLGLNIVLLLSFITGCSSMEKQVVASSKEKVIVVGAGLSGLITALHLENNGIDVVLLEKEPRVGGRIYSMTLGDVAVNLGAQYFFECDNEYLNYYIKRAKKFYPERGLFGALWDDEYVTSRTEELFLKLPIDQNALFEFEDSIKKMTKDQKRLEMHKKEFYLDKDHTIPEWSILDSKSAGEYLSDYHPDVKKLYNAFLIPEGGAGVDETSAMLLVGWYGGSNKGNSYLIEDGNQKLTETIADDIRNLGGEIILSTEVLEVVQTETGVAVKSLYGETYEADYAVVTTPATVSRKIIKGLSPEKQQALEAVIYGASMQVGLNLRNIPKDERISSCFFHSENINAYMDQTKDQMGDNTVVSLNIAGSETHNMSDNEILDYVSETLQKIYPDFSREESIIDYEIKKWTDGIVRYPPGFLDSYQEILRAPFGRIFFAGDYTHNPSLDGAAWSGVRAGDQILEKLN